MSSQLALLTSNVASRMVSNTGLPVLAQHWPTQHCLVVRKSVEAQHLHSRPRPVLALAEHFRSVLVVPALSDDTLGRHCGSAAAVVVVVVLVEQLVALRLEHRPVEVAVELARTVADVVANGAAAAAAAGFAVAIPIAHRLRQLEDSRASHQHHHLHHHPNPRHQLENNWRDCCSNSRCLDSADYIRYHRSRDRQIRHRYRVDQQPSGRATCR